MKTTLSAESSAAPAANPSPGARPTAPPFSEAGLWQEFGSGWRPLCPGFATQGFSVEWHDFQCGTALELGGSFHPDSVELCLNVAGEAEFALPDGPHALPPGNAAFYAPGRATLPARRLPAQRHQFLTVELSRDYLKHRLAGRAAGLHPQIQAVLTGKKHPATLSEARPLTAAHQRLIPDLQNSPATLHGRALWFEAKVLELIAEFFFAGGETELFCERQRRVARERVDKVIALLRHNLAEPPDLLELGRRAGCSPFHLSRTFSQELGMTIPRYLRQLRLERAAELLLAGKHNVTEAAMEVGYSSLSHFSQAFCQTMGCCPNLYPLIRRQPGQAARLRRPGAAGAGAPAVTSRTDRPNRS